MTKLMQFLYALRCRLHAPVIEPQPHVTLTAIYCGNCSGEETQVPRKTFLRSNGTCSECGGRSFALAAILGAELRDKLKRDRAIRIQFDQLEHGKHNEVYTTDPAVLAD